MDEPQATCFVPPTLRDIAAAPVRIKVDDCQGEFVLDEQFQSSKLLWWVGLLASAGVGGGVIERFLGEMEEICHSFEGMSSTIASQEQSIRILNRRLEENELNATKTCAAMEG